jgi:hypothetical protein
VPTSHPRVQVTLDPELASAVDRAGAQLEGAYGRAGVIRALALRGAEEISRQAARDAQARAQAVEALLEYDFSQLDDVVARREADMAERLPAPSQPARPR